MKLKTALLYKCTIAGPYTTLQYTKVHQLSD